MFRSLRKLHSAQNRSKKTGRTRSRRLLFEPMESRRLLATSQSSLFDRIDQHLDNAPGVAGAAVINLTTGEEVVVNGDFVFSMSSTIKSGVLFALMRRVDADPGVTMNTVVDGQTLTQLATSMITVSSNSATNSLIDFLTFDAINDEFEALGLTQTVLGRYMSGGPARQPGNNSPEDDYADGFDNESTAREYATFLQLVHENDGLLTNTSYNTYWNIMRQDGDGGVNTKGSLDNLYNSGVLGTWPTFIDRANKPGGKSFTGSPGDFVFNPALGSHSHSSEAGRLIFTNTGEVVFYAVFVNYASGDLSTPIAQVGYEIAAEFAEAPATYTPSAAQLDDGRVLTVRGTEGNDNIDITRPPDDIDNLDITVNGSFIASIDPENNAGVDLVNRIYVYGRSGDDDIDLDAISIPVSTVVFGENGHDSLNVDSAASLVGGSGNDVLSGSDEVDFLTGDSGNDTLSGLGGNDILIGGIGNDTLSGGNGDDILTDVSGNDSLSGGDGEDSLNSGQGNDTLSGGDDNDSLTGGSGIDVLSGGNGADLLWGGADDDTLNGNSGSDELRGESGHDLLIGGADSDSLYGGDDDDGLIGGYQTDAVSFVWDQSGDLLDGGGGNDTILGDNGQLLPLVLGSTGGDDVIRGGTGSDLVFAQGGNDNVQGNGDDDFVYAGDGNDTVLGGTLNPIAGLPVFIADGSDFVDGGNGNDTVYGDNWQIGFSPTISFGGERDTLRGGNGNDLVFGQTGNDQLEGGAGDDTLLAGAGDDVADGNGGQDTVRGDVGHDRIVGSEGSDSLYGDAGNDVVVGGRFFVTPNNTPDTSDDLLEGGDGNDFLLGDSAYLPLALATNVGGNDTLRGDAGNDIMYGQVGNDVLEGGSGHDNLLGGAGDDELLAGSGDDVGNGEAGDDLLVGGSGDDTLTGAADNDRIVGGNLLGAQWEIGADLLNGGSGDDLIRGDSGPADDSDAITILGGADAITGGSGNDVILGQHGNDLIDAGFGSDLVDAGSGNDAVDGGANNDVLSGGGGNDVVVGGAGNDQIDGDQGDDIAIGGAYFATGAAFAETGHDVVRGGTGHDWVFGDSWALETPLDFGDAGGNDMLEGGDGDDLVIGQAGNDILSGGEDSDIVSGRQGNDLVRGGAGDDEVFGDAGNDVLLGDAGVDEVTGGPGLDVLIGGADADELAGHGGDDLLIGGTTTFDANDAALRMIAAEWFSARSYAHRIANLRGNPNPTFANRLNGSNFLVSGETVLDDGALDTLVGHSGVDWFFVDPPDTADDAAGEQVN